MFCHSMKFENVKFVCFVFWHHYLLSLLLIFVLASRNWRYNVTLIAFRCCLSRVAVCVGFFGCCGSFRLLFSLFMGHITETERFVGVVNAIREAIAQLCLSCPLPPPPAPRFLCPCVCLSLMAYLYI